MAGAGFKGSLPIVLTACIGLVAAMAVGVLSMNAERRLDWIELHHRVSDGFLDINHELADNLQSLSMLRVFFESDGDPVTRDEFLRAAAPIRKAAPGLQLVGWAPRVPETERERFERSMRDAGFAGFQITDWTEAGLIIRAPDRPVHYPMLYEEASSGKAFRTLGRDLQSGAAHAAAIAEAIRANAAAATPPYLLHQADAPVGFIAYVPVLRSVGAESNRPVQLNGLLFGVYDLPKLLDTIEADLQEVSGLDIYVYNQSGMPGHRLAYWHAGDGRQGPPPDEGVVRLLPHIDTSIRLLDQTLGAVVVPLRGIGAVWKWRVLEPAVVVLLLTGGLVAYLVLSVRRTQQMHAMAENLRDTTVGLEQKAATIAHMARHDALTGLPNRIFFAEALAHSLGDGAPCAILQIGLDRFKAVNEFHGHAAGDAVLQEVARRLCAVIRSDAVVARLGGDAFAVIVGNAAAGEAGLTVAKRLIEAIGLPIESGHGCVSVGCSIGVACFPSDGQDVEKLLRAADFAMGTAKRRDRGSLCRFEPGMDEEVRSRLALEADLRQAIKAGEIRPYYQPVVRLQDAALVGFEILARWQHARRGMVMPDAFIGLAESTGLIGDMTYSLLRRAAADAENWPEHLYLALNISPIHLKKTDLADDILSILRDTGFDPLRLEVEITESALVGNMDIAKRSLLSLQRAGVRVALDDFGTGYSSLVHLRQLPLNKVKIDRSFVSHSLDDAENGKIVVAIVGLGKSLGIATTAEGIETKEVALSLAALGCDYGQGYFFAQPMTPEAAAKLYGFDRPAKRLRAERLQMSGGAAR